ncbi:MAG: PP2C family protein-serine/threonine phosphatase, partial [Candidatus Acidiferrales bacterium]
IHSLAARPGSLDELARALNHYACDHSLMGMRFTTAFLAEYDSSSQRIRYVNAGHNAPFLRRATGAIERLSEGCVPFGIDSLTDYRSVVVTIERGDLLVIFTDGLAEAVNGDGKEYGEARIQARVETFTHEPAASVLAFLMGDVDTFVGPARQHDDITCMAVRFLYQNERV